MPYPQVTGAHGDLEAVSFMLLDIVLTRTPMIAYWPGANAP